MSIATSREERAEAAKRLESIPTEVLERDLQHWTLTAFDTSDQYDQLTEDIHAVQAQQQAMQRLHEEENAWIRLHVDELRRRRAQAREEVRS